MSSITELEILQPDDFHHHLRDGDVLKEIVQHASRSFGRILAMPNIKPPVRTLEEVSNIARTTSSQEAVTDPTYLHQQHIIFFNSYVRSFLLYIADNKRQF